MIKRNPGVFFLLLIISLSACKTTTTQAPKILSPAAYYGSELYHDIQLAHLYPDSKTFSDAVPKRALSEIIDAYALVKDSEGFALKSFVEANFELPGAFQESFKSDLNRSMEEHIAALWSELTRNPDQFNPHASLLPLPKRYIVPGGRFREIYYWDSYFTIEGLLLHDPVLAEEMLDNFAFLIDSLGFIPNGNRNYYLTRSQPPFFALMVGAISRENDDKLLKYVPQLQKEYDYWMLDNKKVNVKGMTLNKYHDTGITPRPESYREDFELAEELNSDEARQKLYSNLRSGAMSGWDYSTRWFADNQNLASIEINDILPVDLNCLLYYLEDLLAQGYDLAGNEEKQLFFEKAAKQRKENIQQLFWNEESEYFEDYHVLNEKHTGRRTLAGAFPIFMKIASEEQASGVKNTLESEFLKPGGFVTSLQNSGQQWDAPNGWAPLQWISINGLKNYGYEAVANEAANRWININRKVYRNTGKMMEKYNVMDTTLTAGGGEYPNQDGFGWTNGVVTALLDQQK
ncbi:MAG: trehalase family glycosidase [Bacteroidia bacterium]|nr:trehalase family glycosidase [Bacteroidia bacterium]